MGKRAKRPGRPAKAYSQAHRLVELYDLLHRGGRIHAASIAAERGVSRRTIERDVRVLEEVLGGRLVRKDTPGVGMRWLLDRPRASWKTTRWQVLALALGARMARFLSGRRFDTEVAGVIEQLRESMLPGRRLDVRRLEKKIHVISPGWKEYRKNERAQRQLDEMVEGLLSDRPVELRYLSPSRAEKGEAPRALRVRPLTLVVFRQAAYFVVDVLGGDPSKVGRRILLALDRIEGASCDREAEMMEAVHDYEPSAYFASSFGLFTSQEAARVRLKVASGYATYVRERAWHPSQLMEESMEGDLLVELEVAPGWELQDWILGMGEHVEVLEPAELRSKVVKRLREALEGYDSDAT